MRNCSLISRQVQCLLLKLVKQLFYHFWLNFIQNIIIIPVSKHNGSHNGKWQPWFKSNSTLKIKLIFLMHRQRNRKTQGKLFTLLFPFQNEDTRKKVLPVNYTIFFFCHDNLNKILFSTSRSMPQNVNFSFTLLMTVKIYLIATNYVYFIFFVLWWFAVLVTRI